MFLCCFLSQFVVFFDSWYGPPPGDSCVPAGGPPSYLILSISFSTLTKAKISPSVFSPLDVEFFSPKKTGLPFLPS